MSQPVVFVERPVKRTRRRRFIALGVGALLLVAGAVSAALLIRHDISTTASAAAGDVTFANGDDYASINAAGFATLSLGSSATSATLALSGIPGAALVQMGDVLKIANSDATTAYTVTFARSTTPNAAISDMIVKVYTSGDSLVTSWDAADAASSSSFNLPVSTTYDITLEIAIDDGTAAGSLGSFDIQMSLVPA